jgi:C4-type Zn-finger protein
MFRRNEGKEMKKFNSNQSCPKCESSNTFLRKTFKKAFFGKPNRITYRCEMCGYKFTTLAGGEEYK